MLEAVILGVLALITLLAKAYVNHQSNAAIDERLKAMETEFERKRKEQEAADVKEAEEVHLSGDPVRAADFLRDSFK